MKKTILLVVVTILILISSTSDASDKWTQEDTKYQLVYSILQTADWLQTRYIAKHPETYYEKNKYLGEHPSVGRVDTYHVSALVLQMVIAYNLPRPYRRIWQCVWIGREMYSVNNNYNIGIKLDFNF